MPLVSSERGAVNTVGVILLVALAVAAAAIIAVTVTNIGLNSENPSTGVSYDESQERVNAQIVSADRVDTVTVRSPLGTKYDVSSANPGESEGLVAFTNRKYTTIAEYEGKEQVTGSHKSGTGFTWDIAVDKHGTEDYTSIQAAIDNASPGDVIAIEKATYKENVNVDKDVTLVAEDGTVIQDQAPLEDVLQITADGAQVYNTQVNCDPTTGDGHYARHGVNIQGNNVRVEGVSVKNCGNAPSGTQAGVVIDGQDITVRGSKVSNSEVGVLAKSGSGSAIIRGNSIAGSVADISNKGLQTLDARRNHFPGSANLQGVVDASNKKPSFAGPSIAGGAGPGQSGNPLSVAGKMAVSNSGKVFIQNGGPSVDFFKATITITVNGKEIVVRPTSSNEFKVVSSDSGIDPSKVFDSKKIGQAGRTLSGQSVSDSSKATLSTGESLSFDLNENYVDTSSVSVEASAPADSIVNGGSSQSGSVTLASADSGTQSSSNVISASNVASSTKTEIQSSQSTDFSVSAGADYTIQPGTSLTFSAAVNGLSASDISSYEWKVDGSVVSSSQSFTRTFDTTGEHRVVLTVKSSDGSTASDSSIITVSSSASGKNIEPSATIRGNMQLDAGQTTTLDASDSYDPDGSIASYKWDTNGDGKVDATGSSVQFSREQTGEYTVKLTVTDNDGATATKQATVSIIQAPDPGFSVSPSSPDAGEQITFDAGKSTDDMGIASYEWDFDGDGTIDATGETVMHTYSTSTSKQVTLTVTDTDGVSRSLTKAVELSDFATRSFSHSQGCCGKSDTSGTVYSNLPKGEYKITVDYRAEHNYDNNDGFVRMKANGQEFYYGWDRERQTDTGTHTYTLTSQGGQDVTMYCKIDDQSAEANYASGPTTCEMDITIELINKGPQGAFTISDSTPRLGDTVTLDASGSADNGAISKYEWDIGNDGDIDKTGKQVQFTVQEAGYTPIKLYTTDDSGFKTSVTNSLETVRYDTTSFSHSQGCCGKSDNRDTVYSNLPRGEYVVKIDYKAEHRYDNNPGYIRMKFEGSQFYQSSDQAVIRTGTTSFTVTSNGGQDLTAYCKIDDQSSENNPSGASQCEMDIRIYQINPGPKPQISVSDSSPQVGDTITLDASGSTDNSAITKYEWDIGNDGDIDKTGKNVDFTVQKAGYNTVKLKVTDDTGFTTTTTKQFETTRFDTKSFSYSQGCCGTSDTRGTVYSNLPKGEYTIYVDYKAEHRYDNDPGYIGMEFEGNRFYSSSTQGVIRTGTEKFTVTSNGGQDLTAYCRIDDQSSENNPRGASQCEMDIRIYKTG